MSTTSKETKRTNEYTSVVKQAMRKHLDAWQNGIAQLEDELERFTKETQVTYREKIDQLSRQLHELKTRYTSMIEGGDEEWMKGQAGFQEKLTGFRQAFLETSRSMSAEDDKVSLGWLQGFTDERTLESEGWAEGMGHRAGASEGWAEGMGEQGSESKGWAEGYKNK